MSQVVIDCTPALFPTNGIGRVTIDLLKEMIRQKGSKDLLLYTRSLRKNLTLFPECRKLRVRLPKLLEGIINKCMLIEKMAPKESIFHATNHYMPVKYPERTIVTVHDLIFLKSPEEHLRGIHREMARKAPAFIKKSKHIITCSEYTKRDLQEFLDIPPEKISVIPWGLNQSLFKPPEDKSQNSISVTEKFGIANPYFLGVSCSMGRKNTQLILNAYKKLLKDHPENDLVLVWDPPADIYQKFKHPRIHFTGKVNDEDLQRLYGSATATVYPSFYEGFGLPVLESMSCGTPIICSKVTSLPEVGGDAALYMNPFDENSLLEQMCKFENHSLDHKKIINNGLNRAKEFTWKACAQKTLNIYKRYST